MFNIHTAMAAIDDTINIDDETDSTERIIDINVLPVEVLCIIFGYVNMMDYFNIRGVCRLWFAIKFKFHYRLDLSHHRFIVHSKYASLNDYGYYRIYDYDNLQLYLEYIKLLMNHGSACSIRNALFATSNANDLQDTYHNHIIRILFNGLFIACKEGRLGALKAMIESIDITLQSSRRKIIKGFRKACGSGELEVVTFICDNFKVTKKEAKSDDNDAFIMACINGHLPVAQFIHKKYTMLDNEVRFNKNMAFINACASGHLAMVIWMNDTFKLSVTGNDNSILKAYSSSGWLGQYEVEDWLKTTFPKIIKEPVDTGNKCNRCKKFISKKKKLCSYCEVSLDRYST